MKWMLMLIQLVEGFLFTVTWWVVHERSKELKLFQLVRLEVDGWFFLSG